MHVCAISGENFVATNNSRHDWKSKVSDDSNSVQCFWLCIELHGVAHIRSCFMKSVSSSFGCFWLCLEVKFSENWLCGREVSTSAWYLGDFRLRSGTRSSLSWLRVYVMFFSHYRKCSDSKLTRISWKNWLAYYPSISTLCGVIEPNLM
jgi:hypothetical protein